MTGSPAVVVRGLRRRFGDLEAVRGIDLEIARGEVFALLGPNGAGKTTTVETLEGYQRADAGEVRVLGFDPARRERALLERIGVVLQECSVEPRLNVTEVLRRRAAYYEHPREPDEIVSLVGLEGRSRARVRALSGGQQRRLDLGLALVGDPELVFLDEPTTGFDPSARRGAWDLVRALASEGRTVVLTTHYMDEAQALADRIAVIARGEIVAAGSPDAIGGRRDAASQVRLRVAREHAHDAPVPAHARRRDLSPAEVALEFETVIPAADLYRLTGWALARGIELGGLEVVRPSLEDVYLELTAEQDATR